MSFCFLIVLPKLMRSGDSAGGQRLLDLGHRRGCVEARAQLRQEIESHGRRIGLHRIERAPRGEAGRRRSPDDSRARRRDRTTRRGPSSRLRARKSLMRSVHAAGSPKSAGSFRAWNQCRGFRWRRALHTARWRRECAVVDPPTRPAPANPTMGFEKPSADRVSGQLLRRGARRAKAGTPQRSEPSFGQGKRPVRTPGKISTSLFGRRPSEGRPRPTKSPVRRCFKSRPPLGGVRRFASGCRSSRGGWARPLVQIPALTDTRPQARAYWATSLFVRSGRAAGARGFLRSRRTISCREASVGSRSLATSSSAAPHAASRRARRSRGSALSDSRVPARCSGGGTIGGRCEEVEVISV